jgi:hypothetical protein
MGRPLHSLVVDTVDSHFSDSKRQKGRWRDATFDNTQEYRDTYTPIGLSEGL